MMDQMPNAAGNSTVLRGAAILAAGRNGARLIPCADLVHEAGTITHVGDRWEGPACKVIELPGRLILPGFISTDTSLTPGPAGAIGEMSIHRNACEAEYSICWALMQLLRSGVTTIVAPGGRLACSESLAQAAGELGIRLYHGPDIVDAATGTAHLASALAFARTWDGAFDGRIRAMLSAGPSVRLDAPLARALSNAAAQLQLPLSVRVAATVGEFHERLRTSGMTPVQWLHQHALLTPATILSDCQFLAGSRFSAYPWNSDVPLIHKAQAAVSADALTSLHAGHGPGWLQELLEADVCVSLGSHTPPWDMFDGMRAASLGWKVDRGDHLAGTGRTVLDMSTLGGARALKRLDLGMLEPGGAADFVVLDLNDIRVGPYLDPVRAALSGADAGTVEHVVVNGKFILRDRRPFAWDEHEIVRTMRRVAEPATA